MNKRHHHQRHNATYKPPFRLKNRRVSTHTLKKKLKNWKLTRQEKFFFLNFFFRVQGNLNEMKRKKKKRKYWKYNKKRSSSGRAFPGTNKGAMKIRDVIFLFMTREIFHFMCDSFAENNFFFFNFFFFQINITRMQHKFRGIAIESFNVGAWCIRPRKRYFVLFYAGKFIIVVCSFMGKEFSDKQNNADDVSDRKAKPAGWWDS